MSATAQRNRQSIRRPTPRYLELVRQFPLRPLRSRSDIDAATAILDRLFGREKVDPGESNYVEALALLVASYEERRRPIDSADASGLDVLRHFVEESRIKQSELAALLGVGPSATSMILSGDRPITADHARKLAKRFKLSPAAFL